MGEIFSDARKKKIVRIINILTILYIMLFSQKYRYNTVIMHVTSIIFIKINLNKD